MSEFEIDLFRCASGFIVFRWRPQVERERESCYVLTLTRLHEQRAEPVQYADITTKKGRRKKREREPPAYTKSRAHGDYFYVFKARQLHTRFLLSFLCLPLSPYIYTHTYIRVYTCSIIFSVSRPFCSL